MPHIDTFKWLISRLRRLRMNVMKARWHMLEQVGWEMARLFRSLYGMLRQIGMKVSISLVLRAEHSYLKHPQ